LESPGAFKGIIDNQPAIYDEGNANGGPSPRLTAYLECEME
jgi:hypothetical protein